MSQPDFLHDALKGLQSANEITALRAQVKTLTHRVDGLREAGDEMWYCLRHTANLVPSEIAEAVEDWIEARNNA